MIGGRSRGAHRASWVLANGPIPAGQNVLHRCDNRKCVNPEHLFLGTLADNTADMLSKGRHARVSQPGESHGRAKLTEAQVRAIQEAPYGTVGALAKKFGITATHASDLRSGARWKHLKGEKS